MRYLKSQFYLIVTLAIVIGASSGCASKDRGKTTFNCDTFLAQKIVITNETNTDSLLNEFQKLKHCGISDEDAKYLLSGPVLGTVMVKLANEKGSDITFGDFLTALTEYSKTEYYQQLKKKLGSKE